MNRHQFKDFAIRCLTDKYQFEDFIGKCVNFVQGKEVSDQADYDSLKRTETENEPASP